MLHVSGHIDSETTAVQLERQKEREKPMVKLFRTHGDICETPSTVMKRRLVTCLQSL